MRDAFSGYYPPTLDQYKRLWTEATIVLDTNLLLDLYRLPETARDDLISVLNGVKERLWIPYQVALEYQRNRLSVIADGRKTTELALRSVGELASGARQRVSDLQMEKRGLGIDTQPLLTELDEVSRKLREAISTVQSSQLDISANDPVRDKIDDLLAGKVGRAPASQEDLQSLVVDGDQRFAQRIPPGYEDAKKERNPDQATFLHDHIVYERKYGDLILWRQTLRHAKENKVKSLMFVTSDRKEDWWQVVQGRTIGPLPELIRETYREADIDLFWMYTSDQFVEHAKTYTTTKVGEMTVAQIKSVSEEGQRAAAAALFDYAASNFERIPSEELDKYVINPHPRIDAENAETAVKRWLEKKSGTTVNMTGDFPDLLTLEDGAFVGYEVRYQSSFEKMLFTPNVINAMLRGYMERQEKHVDKFVIIVAGAPSAWTGIFDMEDGLGRLRSRVESLLQKYPVDGMVLGILSNGEFQDIVRVP